MLPNGTEKIAAFENLHAWLAAEDIEGRGDVEIFSFDASGDGRRDLIVSSSRGDLNLGSREAGSYCLCLFLRAASDGSYEASVLEAANGDSAGGAILMDIIDLNGDGKPELVFDTWHEGGEALSIKAWTGKGWDMVLSASMDL